MKGYEREKRVLDRSFCKSKGGKSRRNLGRTVSTAHALIGEQGLEEEEKGKKKDGLDSVGRVSLAGDLDPRKRIHAYSRRSLGKTKPKKGESVTGEACVCLSVSGQPGGNHDASQKRSVRTDQEMGDPKPPWDGMDRYPLGNREKGSDVQSFKDEVQ